MRAFAGLARLFLLIGRMFAMGGTFAVVVSVAVVTLLVVGVTGLARSRNRGDGSD